MLGFSGSNTSNGTLSASQLPRLRLTSHLPTLEKSSVTMVSIREALRQIQNLSDVSSRSMPLLESDISIGSRNAVQLLVLFIATESRVPQRLALVGQPLAVVTQLERLFKLQPAVLGEDPNSRVVVLLAAKMLEEKFSSDPISNLRNDQFAQLLLPLLDFTEPALLQALVPTLMKFKMSDPIHRALGKRLGNANVGSELVGSIESQSMESNTQTSSNLVDVSGPPRGLRSHVRVPAKPLARDILASLGSISKELRRVVEFSGNDNEEHLRSSHQNFTAGALNVLESIPALPPLQAFESLNQLAVLVKECHVDIPEIFATAAALFRNCHQDIPPRSLEYMFELAGNIGLSEKSPMLKSFEDQALDLLPSFSLQSIAHLSYAASMTLMGHRKDLVQRSYERIAEAGFMSIPAGARLHIWKACRVNGISLSDQEYQVIESTFPKIQRLYNEVSSSELIFLSCLTDHGVSFTAQVDAIGYSYDCMLHSKKGELTSCALEFDGPRHYSRIRHFSNVLSGSSKVRLEATQKAGIVLASVSSRELPDRHKVSASEYRDRMFGAVGRLLGTIKWFDSKFEPELFPSAGRLSGRLAPS